MIQVSAPMRIFVAIEAVDFRKGIDGLCRLCRDKMEEAPFSGALFVFRNRRVALRLSCCSMMARAIGCAKSVFLRDGLTGGLIQLMSR
jgi:transposase